MIFRTITAASAAFLLGFSSASAQISTVDGDTSGAATFNRASNGNFGEPAPFTALSTNGTNIEFQTIPFSVTSAGAVRLETVDVGGLNDTVLYVYSSFDPAAPLANGVSTNDDDGAGLLSLINAPLPAGQYVAVVTGFFNGQAGVFRLELEGPVFVGVLGGDGGIAATEAGLAVTTAQTQGLRQILLANKEARNAAARNTNSLTSMTANGISTADVSVWAEVAGSQFNGDFGGDLDVSTFLGQAGVEFAVSPSLAAGVSIGGVRTDANATMVDLEGEGLFVQPYIAFADQGFTAIASLAFTYTDYDDDTDIIDSGERFSGSLFLGYGVPVSGDVVATPFAFGAGGFETLDTSSGNEDTEFFTGRLGVELSHSMELLNTGSLRSFGSIAAEYNSTDEPELAAAATLTDYDDSRLGGRVEVGLDFTLAGTDTQIFAAGNGSGLFTDGTSVGGRLGIKIPF